MMKKWLIRRGILAAVILVGGMLILWRTAPSATMVDTTACTRELTAAYERIVAYSAENAGKLPERLECDGFVYLGPEFDWQQITPLLVEEPGRHKAVNGKSAVCLLLNNGKIVVWQSLAADRTALADELAAVYPHDQLTWPEHLAHPGSDH